MDKQHLEALIRELHTELAGKQVDDPETLALVRQLEGDIEPLLTTGADGSLGLKDLLTSLEARFAADYPDAEQFFRNIVDTLQKMGI